jgi:zinc transport system permease protein
LLDDFLIRAALGGMGVALIAGPLGCFVVWRRMAFFGHALAHTALLGIGLGTVLALDLTAMTLAVCIGFALLLTLLQEQREIADDTVLGIVSHGALALGVLVISFAGTVRVDLAAYLFGDVLAVSRADLIWIFAGGALVLATLVGLWPSLLRLTLSEELARAEGVRVPAIRTAFMLLMALSVAIGMKIVGILLVISLLVIPAAAARPWARTPEQMAAIAAATGVLAVLSGLQLSLRFDTPSGASIVVAAAALFALSITIGRLRRR